MKKLAIYASGFASVVLVCSPVMAADLDPGVIDPCAVSGFNAKAEAAGGYYKARANSGSRKGGRAHGALSVTFPLGCTFGFQADGAIGTLAGKTTGGIAGHLFVRNPTSYLLGVYGEYSAVGKNDIWRIGGEAEVYLDRVTFSAIGGFEDSQRTKPDAFASLTLSFYATDNFRLYGGFRHFLKISAGAVGAEWQFDATPISLFAEGQFGTKRHASVMAGLRFHFGAGDKSLIRRHREDDPFLAITGMWAATPNPPRSMTGGECCFKTR